MHLLIQCIHLCELELSTPESSHPIDYTLAYTFRSLNINMAYESISWSTTLSMISLPHPNDNYFHFVHFPSIYSLILVLRACPRSTSHTPTRSIYSLTLMLKARPRSDQALIMCPLGIHGSFPTCMLSPISICHSTPFFRSSRPLKNASSSVRHAIDNIHFLILDSLEYTVLSTLHGVLELGGGAILPHQHGHIEYMQNVATINLLFFSTLSTSPGWSTGTNSYYLVDSTYLLIKASISSQSFLVRSKQDIAFVGIGWATCLVSTARPSALGTQFSYSPMPKVHQEVS